MDGFTGKRGHALIIMVLLYLLLLIFKFRPSWLLFSGYICEKNRFKFVDFQSEIIIMLWLFIGIDSERQFQCTASSYICHLQQKNCKIYFTLMLNLEQAYETIVFVLFV